MLQPPETFLRVMMHVGTNPFLLFPLETMWRRARAGHLQIGDQSNDFEAGGKAKSSLAAHANLDGCPPFGLLLDSPICTPD